MLSFFLALLSVLEYSVCAQVGDNIVQNLEAKAHKNCAPTTTVTSFASTFPTNVAVPGMFGTAFSTLSPSISVSSAMVSRLHLLPSTVIVPSSVPRASAWTVDLSRVLSNTTVANIDLGDGTTGSLVCQYCATFGSLSFTAYGFERIINTSSQTDQFEKMHNGSFLVRFHGLGGTMQFQLIASETLSHECIFLSIPVPLGYVIRRVATVGLTLAIAVPLALTIEAPMDATFGFSYTLPDDAFVNITLGTPKGSHAHGFAADQGSQCYVLPIMANTTDGDVSLIRSLQTSLNIWTSVLPHASGVMDSPAVTARPSEMAPWGHSSATEARVNESMASPTRTFPASRTPKSFIPSPSRFSALQPPSSIAMRDQTSTTSGRSATTTAPPPGTSVYAGLAKSNMSPAALVLLPFVYWGLSAAVERW
nr:hypothetical protein CFP56_09863 [Quercus suber]